MPNNADLKQKEIELQERLAPHVDGELLAAGTASAGSNLVATYRSGGVYSAGILEFLLIRKVQRSIARRLAEKRNEEQDLPSPVWLALTAEDVYVFPITGRKKDVQPPLRRWSRASLQSVGEQPFGRSRLIVLTLESGRKAIFGLNFNSKALQARIRETLGLPDAAGASA